MTPEQRKRVKGETCGSPVTVRTSGTTSSYEPVKQLDRGKVLTILDEQINREVQSELGIGAIIFATGLKELINSGRLDVEEG